MSISPNANAQRLHKVLAEQGLGSRRYIEELIGAGQILVNGQPAILGQKVTRRDKVIFQGKPVLWQRATETQLLLYYKPEGELCTHYDPEGRRTIYESLPKSPSGRWVSIGRLDINTAGLILVTNDGDLAHRLMHPSFGWQREYKVKCRGRMNEAVLTELEKGVFLDDQIAKFEALQCIRSSGQVHWLKAILMEGRNREVRRLLETQELQVLKLMRVRFGPYELPHGMQPGQYQELSLPNSEQASAKRPARKQTRVLR